MDVSSSLATKYKHHVGRVRSGTFSSNNDTNNVTVYKSPPASSIAEKNTQYSFSSNVVKPRKAVKFNQHSRVSPSTIDLPPNMKQQLKPSTKRLRQIPCRRAWCVFCSAVMCGIFLAAVISTILVVILPHGTTTTTTSTTSTTSTTTTSTTTTTTTTTSTSTTSTSTTSTSTSTTSTTTTTATTIPSCTSPNTAGAIFSFASGSAPTTYTLYTHGFTAAGSSATLSFIMTGDSGPAFHYWLLDTVSVNDTVNNANILVNGGFSTGTLTGWTQYCATNANCGGTSTDYGQLTTSTCQTGSYCYVDKCNNYDYLIQLFNTTIGNYYIISFYLRIFANGGPHLAYVMLA
ncbi:unnamed protein product [Rotaria socialis]|uniref:Uncharacterized protein n=1 Tax=Rotaria socialis TaxID=392032 RepID=A0A818VCW3_9BILA|nr:unnamed protein product [Rotaria socialis]